MIFCNQFAFEYFLPNFGLLLKTSTYCDHVHTWRIHAFQKRYLWRISLASIMLWYYHNTNRNNFAPHKKWSKAIWEYFWKNAYNMKQNKKAEKDNIFQWKFYFFICPIKITFFSTILVILDIAETVIVFPVVDAMLRVPGLLKLFRFDFMWIFHSGTFRRMCRQVIAKHQYFGTKRYSCKIST